MSRGRHVTRSAKKVALPQVTMEDLKRGSADYLYRVLFIYSRTTVVPEWIDGREVHLPLPLRRLLKRARSAHARSTCTWLMRFLDGGPATRHASVLLRRALPPQEALQGKQPTRRLR